MKYLKTILVFVLSALLVACSSGSSSSSSNNSNTKGIISSDDKILIAYFSQPISGDVDSESSASIVKYSDGTLGNVNFIAKTIQKETKGNLFRIERKTAYDTSSFDATANEAQDEQKKDARPALKNTISNIKDYDVIFIGYPIWWYKMPMPVYTFFDTYDLSGKTIIPFVSHGGSGFSDTIDTIKELEPKATVVEDGLSIARDDVADSEADIKKFVDNLMK